MKKIIIIILLGLLSGLDTSAQSLFTITANPVDSTIINSPPDSAPFSMITQVVNVTDSPIILYWQFISPYTDYPSEWRLTGICDNLLCRPDSGSWISEREIQHTGVIQPGDSSAVDARILVPDASPYGSYGIFKVRVFDNLQSQTDTILFRLCKGGGCTFTGINALNSKDNRISIFPNPATDVLQISLDQGLYADQVWVYDIAGSAQLTCPVVKDKKTTLNINNLSPGMYIIRIADKQGRILASGKFVKTQ